MREGPQPQLFLGDGPQPGQAVRFDDQEEHDQAPKIINSTCEITAVSDVRPNSEPSAGSAWFRKIGSRR
jgi:hypothetical protein